MNVGEIIAVVLVSIAAITTIAGVIYTQSEFRRNQELIKAINELSRSPDLEVVTRCKNCKYSQECKDIFEDKPYYVCYRIAAWRVLPDDYCSMAKPKEEAHGMDKM